MAARPLRGGAPTARPRLPGSVPAAGVPAAGWLLAAALGALVLPVPAEAAIAADAAVLTCDAQDATAGRHSVTLAAPFGAAPSLEGIGGPQPARFFRRGRTLIWDAGQSVLYVDRDNLGFAYSHSGEGGVTTWRGHCRTTP